MGIQQRYPQEIQQALTACRLLNVTPFKQSISRVTQQTANLRNELMTELADEIFVAYAHPGGNLEKLILIQLEVGKTIKTFEVVENKKLIQEGATTESYSLLLHRSFHQQQFLHIRKRSCGHSIVVNAIWYTRCIPFNVIHSGFKFPVH